MSLQSTRKSKRESPPFGPSQQESVLSFLFMQCLDFWIYNPLLLLPLSFQKEIKQLSALLKLHSIV